MPPGATAAAPEATIAAVPETAITAAPEATIAAAPETTIAAAPEPPAPVEPQAAPSATPPAVTALPEAAQIVSLPRPRSDTGDMLGAWGWSDSHSATDDGHYIEDDPAKLRRKQMIIRSAIGCGALLLIVLIAIAMSTGGKKKDTAEDDLSKRPSRTAVDPATKPAEPVTEPSAPIAPQGSVVEDTQAAADKAAADKAAADKAAADKAAANKTAADKERLAKAAAASPPPRKDPRRVAMKGEPVDPYAAQKPDPAAAFKLGFQQYVRGNTSEALATFKASLQDNPGYPPTYRGLGLVYEKLGQHNAAKLSFKRYLQLAPDASDAAQIREHMDRL
jgi:hypothetical protein